MIPISGHLEQPEPDAARAAGRPGREDHALRGGGGGIRADVARAAAQDLCAGGADQRRAERNLAGNSEGKSAARSEHVARRRPAGRKIPYTPEGRKRWDAVPKMGKPMLANAPEDRNFTERCITTDGLLVPNPFYNNYFEIVQAPGHVAIVTEMMHEVRVIPLDRRPHVGSGVRMWSGDSRGWWEGQTLVVETRNFNDKMLFRGATSELRLVERFTRLDADTIEYRLTVTDPATFTRPWTLVNGLRRADGGIYEVACHEGNIGLRGILAGARAQEAK